MNSIKLIFYINLSVWYLFTDCIFAMNFRSNIKPLTKGLAATIGLNKLNSPDFFVQSDNQKPTPTVQDRNQSTSVTTAPSVIKKNIPKTIITNGQKNNIHTQTQVSTQEQPQKFNMLATAMAGKKIVPTQPNTPENFSLYHTLYPKQKLTILTKSTPSEMTSVKNNQKDIKNEHVTTDLAVPKAHETSIEKHDVQSAQVTYFTQEKPSVTTDAIPGTKPEPIEPEQLEISTIKKIEKNTIESKESPEDIQTIHEMKSASSNNLQEKIQDQYTLQEVQVHQDQNLSSAQSLHTEKVDTPTPTQFTEFKTWEHQTTPEHIDILAKQKEKDADHIIANWEQEYADTTSNMYIQENLKDELAKALLVTDKFGNITMVDRLDIETIKKLENKYKNKSDVHNALYELLIHLQEQFQQQKPTAHQANQIIARYYTTDMVQTIFQGLGKTTGQNNTIPSVEEILHYAQSNPSRQSFNALQAATKGVELALFAYKHDTHTPLFQQLTTFKEQLHIMKAKPQFEAYQDTMYHMKGYLGNFLDNTGVGNVTIDQAAQTVSTAANMVNTTTNAILDVLGLQPYVQLAHNTLTSSAINTLKNIKVKDALTMINSTPQKEPEIYTAQKTIKALQGKEYISAQAHEKIKLLQEKDQKVQAETSALIEQYMRPEDKALLQKMLAEGQNITVENIIQQALEAPSQQAYTALQAMLHTIKVILQPTVTPADPLYIGGWTKYKQLYAYKLELEQAVENKTFDTFRPLTEQISRYAQSYIPTPESILSATGLENSTLYDVGSTTYQTAKNAAVTAASTTESLTGFNPITAIKNSTIRDMTNTLGLTH